MSVEGSDAPTLAWRDPDAGEGSYPLAEGDTVAGRDESADLVLASPTVSRRHARFERIASVVRVHDLESRNGTFVNGERITSRELGHGDELRLGNLALIVSLPVLSRLVGPPRPPSPWRQVCSSRTLAISRSPCLRRSPSWRRRR